MKFFCLVLSLLVVGCSTEPSNQTKHYIDINGFVDKQVSLLNQEKPPVNKQMVADGKTDQKQIVVSDWVKELALFRLLDLNKQAYILSYQTTRSDSLTYQYKLKPKEKAPVQLLTIRLNKNSEISQIQAIVQTKNQLYNSEKQLNLNCGKDKKGNWSIKNYSVSGHQKLTMTDKKTFEVVGVILN